MTELASDLASTGNPVVPVPRRDEIVQEVKPFSFTEPGQGKNFTPLVLPSSAETADLPVVDPKDSYAQVPAEFLDTIPTV